MGIISRIHDSVKRKLGDVTNMMLAQSLKDLEAAGMVHREQYNEVPPRVEYCLTDKGQSIVPILVQFANWGADNMKEATACGAKCETCVTIGWEMRIATTQSIVRSMKSTRH
ncbi:winged helix-turn-helix transcriptional regulator [Eubacteriales bacterium OttesenSCG-928-N13]|nr:winged helix-turn-helix transcriptional regulator [Eubacteriales bacterium OttesenSCG-928-N13]